MVLVGDMMMESRPEVVSTKILPAKRHIGNIDGDAASIEMEKPSLNFLK